MLNKLKIIQDQISNCNKCELHKTRTQTVFAKGNPIANIVILGESPGMEEDLAGLPFVGRSGQLLDKTLVDLGLDINNDVYITNVIRCRPPNNRKPSEEEVNHCIGYLEEQLSLIKAKVLIALGNTAVSALLPTTYGITKIRGQFFKYKHLMLMGTYHPSYVLRNGGAGSTTYDLFKQDIQSALDKAKELNTSND